MNKTISAIAIVVSFLAPPAVSAQEETSGSLYGLYGRLQGGAVFVDDFDQSLGPDPLIADAPDRVLAESSIGYSVGAAIGFRYPSGFRTELEYRYVSAPLDQETTFGGLISPSTFPSDDDVTAHFLMSNVYYDFRNTSPVTPFIGVGVGGASVDRGALYGSDAAFAYQGRAGLKVQALEASSISLEYVYTRTRELVFDDVPEGALIASGDPLVVSSALISFQQNF